MCQACRWVWQLAGGQQFLWRFQGEVFLMFVISSPFASSRTDEHRTERTRMGWEGRGEGKGREEKRLTES